MSKQKTRADKATYLKAVDNVRRITQEGEAPTSVYGVTGAAYANSIYWQDCVAVAATHVAGIPKDHNKPIRPEWLKAVGLATEWYPGTWGTPLVMLYGPADPVGVAVCENGAVMMLGGSAMFATAAVVKTRGELREFCKLLRIKLNEGTDAGPAVGA